MPCINGSRIMDTRMIAPCMLEVLTGIPFLEIEGHYIVKVLLGMSSSSRAALGLLGRIAVRGVAMRITLAGMRLRISARVGALGAIRKTQCAAIFLGKFY